MDTLLARLDDRQRERFHAAVRRPPMEAIGPAREWHDALNPSAARGSYPFVGTSTTYDAGLAADAEKSMEFAEWAGDTQTGRLAVDALAYELARIAQSYVHGPPQPVLSELAVLRGEIRRALQAGPSPQRATELLFLGSLAIELLAQATGVLGTTIVAMQHAVAAESLAEQVGYQDLRAWVIGTKALIAEWSGNLPAALAFARQAAAFAPTGHQRLRLAAIEARCAARLGQHRDARAAITRILHGIEGGSTGADAVAQFGGALHFRPAKMACYIGTTYRILGDNRNAELWALEAVHGYSTGPAEERSYGHEAVARADVAIVRIERGAIDSADEVLEPVFAMPDCQRVHRVMESMRAVQKSLHTTGGTSGAAAAALGARIDGFTATDLSRPEQTLPCWTSGGGLSLRVGDTGQ
ncbi:hypothetical protein GFY24_28080 [Nocardia sp. SYP-A9097]|uniref:hypothetical protein n=1 Tax=Nocardia sp. SYP-A9097 TaxID=2663237 RepID=UPI00129AE7EA|nr:hypothetical protein [Nocardia sp. SYP-A9097]MRH91255.1 hypothetical protein [Nocardia sp. SYP-A9097]